MNIYTSKECDNLTCLTANLDKQCSDIVSQLHGYYCSKLELFIYQLILLNCFQLMFVPTKKVPVTRFCYFFTQSK